MEVEYDHLQNLLVPDIRHQDALTRKYYEQEHSESVDLRHGSSIPGLSKPTISTDTAFPPLFHIFADSDLDHSQFIFMDPDSDPDHSQNLITCSLSHLRHMVKISSKSVHNFLSYLS